MELMKSLVNFDPGPIVQVVVRLHDAHPHQRQEANDIGNLIRRNKLSNLLVVAADDHLGPSAGVHCAKSLDELIEDDLVILSFEKENFGPDTEIQILTKPLEKKHEGF